MSRLFSIGYATKKLEDFIGILKTNDVNCIVDVRTSPYSKQFPDYNREQLRYALKDEQIEYLYFGKEFGARREEQEAYSKFTYYDGSEYDIVDFTKTQTLDIFREGTQRIENGLNKGYNICFLCSEKYPYDCHRCEMVSDWFFREGINVTHLVDKEQLIMHSDIASLPNMRELFSKCKKDFYKKYSNILSYDFDMFTGKSTVVPEYVKWWEAFFNDYSHEKCMKLLNFKIGYKIGDENND